MTAALKFRPKRVTEKTELTMYRSQRMSLGLAIFLGITGTLFLLQPFPTIHFTSLQITFILLASFMSLAASLTARFQTRSRIHGTMATVSLVGALILTTVHVAVQERIISASSDPGAAFPIMMGLMGVAFLMNSIVSVREEKRRSTFSHGGSHVK